MNQPGSSLSTLAKIFDPANLLRLATLYLLMALC
jgi:hypothetical protein